MREIQIKKFEQDWGIEMIGVGMIELGLGGGLE